MARNRQRAKQRQAERRAARLADRGRPGGEASEPGPEPDTDGSTGADGSVADEARLAAGAPPEDAGRTDTVLETPPPPDLRDEEQVDEEAELEADDELVADAEAATPEPAQGPRGLRGADREAHAERPRFVQFLFNVWAELQRVQWPNRQALTTLTGVVLGFVLIAGGYLGLLDAIFSRIIQAIL